MNDEAKTKLSQIVPPEVLKDEINLKIIKLLSIKETCGYELTSKLNANAKNISEHIKVLESLGIVKSRREGLRLFYSLANPEIGRIITTLQEMQK
jgi:ArsR family transcriptional regulator